MDMQMFGRISDAFGPSGFEEEVIRTIAGYCGKFEVKNDAMNNLYVRMPGKQEEKPVVQLDAHTDECGFMVQTIHDNGCLGIIMLGGFVLTNVPAHTVVIRTRSGKKIRGITTSKPVHFMNEKERASQSLDIETIYVDIGATSRKEAEEVFGVSVGDPMMPDVQFAFDEEHEANGVSFYGVGNGTTVEYLQAYKGSDDGFEFFGGSVNVRYMVVTSCSDDSFDWTEGWNGKGQFLVAFQEAETTLGYDCDCLMECDSNGNNAAATPVAHPVLSNVTLVGNGS